MKSHHAFLITTVLLFRATISVADDLPTPAEVDSAMRLNREALSSLRIRYSYVQQSHEGYRIHQEIVADSMESVSKSESRPVAERERSAGMAQSIREQLKEFQPGVIGQHRADVWRNGASVQLRLPNEGASYPDAAKK